MDLRLEQPFIFLVVVERGVKEELLKVLFIWASDNV